VSRTQRSLAPRFSLSAHLTFVICYLSFALRLFSLDAQPIWWDEAISIHLARSTPAEIVANRAGNLHSPLYFVILKGWVALVGDSAFGVRFFSVWFSILLIPALYAFGRRWLSRRAGLFAAGLAALSPLYLVYAQEARVYAMLPLVYLALLAVARRLISSPTYRLWFLLTVVEALALGLHYISIFAIAYLLVALFVRLRGRANRLCLLTSQGLALLLFLPWLLVVLGHADALTARLGMSNWRAEPATLAHFVRLLWTFQLTGLAGLISDPLAVWLTAAAAAAMMAALALLLVSPASCRSTVSLLLEWLVPLSSVFVVWRIRPLSHPRYVVMFTTALLLLCASGIDLLLRRSRLAKGAAAFLAASLVATSMFGLALYHSPRVSKDDTSGVAAAIAAHSGADDLVLVPPEDWSVPYYYDGPARVEMDWPGDDGAHWERLAELTEGVETVFLVGYDNTSRDPRAIYPFGLESSGYLGERWDFRGLHVRVYELDRPVAPPELTDADARFGPLRLIGAWVEQGPPADTAVTAALRWRAETVAPRPYRVSLRLRDEQGWEWAARDDWLLNEAALPSDRWAVGREVTTYHVLPLPSGTPPLTYTLTVGAYWMEGEVARPLDLLDEAGNPRGQSFDLGNVSLALPLGLGTDPYGVAAEAGLWETPLELGEGLLLAGAALDREIASPGQPLFVTLRWQATAPVQTRSAAFLALEQGGDTLAAAVAPPGGRYPPEHWTAGQTVVEHRRLAVPPTAGDGPADLVLRVGQRRVELGQVEIVAGEHLFTPPPMACTLGVRFGDVAELLGYDLERTEVAAGDPVPITLYWRALEGAGEADYIVFAHILAADGHLIGQHDGPPASGSRPTPGWVADEIVVDRHEMGLREPYAGLARVEVGLYDAAGLQRVPTDSGETFVLLPVELTVLEH